MMRKNKRLNAILAVIALTCSTGIYADTVNSLTTFGADGKTDNGHVVDYLTSTNDYSTGGLSTWATSVTTQTNADAGAIADMYTSSAFDTAVGNYITPLGFVNTTALNAAISGITTNLYTGNAFTTAVGNYITPLDFATTSQLNTATTALNNSITALQSQQTLHTADISANNAAITDVKTQQTTNTGAISKLQLEVPQSNGFWFVNSASALQTILNNAGAVASATNPQTVKLSGGLYLIANNPLNIPANVTLEGAGELVTQITTSLQTPYLMTMNQNSGLSNLTVLDSTTSTAVIDLESGNAFTVSRVELESAHSPTSLLAAVAVTSNVPVTLGIESSYFNLGVNAVFNSFTAGAQTPLAGSILNLINNKFAASNIDVTGCDIAITGTKGEGWKVNAIADRGQTIDLSTIKWPTCT